jgi:hypothetical protein
MNPPQERIDQFWIRQTEEVIASAVRKIQDQVGRVRKIQDQVGRVRKIQDQVTESGNSRIMREERTVTFLIKQTVEIIVSAVRIIRTR